MTIAEAWAEVERGICRCDDPPAKCGCGFRRLLMRSARDWRPRPTLRMIATTPMAHVRAVLGGALWAMDAYRVAARWADPDVQKRRYDKAIHRVKTNRLGGCERWAT